MGKIKLDYIAMSQASFLFVVSLLAVFSMSSCKSYVDVAGGASATVSNMNSASISTSTTATYIPASGTAYSSFTVDLGTGYQATNVCSTATIFGLLGTASCAVSGTSTVVSVNLLLQSNSSRQPGTAQITQVQEVTTYAGSSSSPSLPSGYHSIPSRLRDDDGWAPNTSAYSQYGTRPQVRCGDLTQNASLTTLTARISDCLTKNGASATWTGGTSGMNGQATWKLVFSSGQTVAGTCLVANGAANQYSTDCYEVWQDQRTGLLWSSSLTRQRGGINGGAHNWCIATGNGSVSGQTMTDLDSTDVNNLCNNLGGTYQNAAGTPFSACEELSPAGVTLSAPTGFCTDGNGTHISVAAGCPGAQFTTNTITTNSTQENYATGIYHISKGYMGALSTPAVRWRAPTINDFEQANVDGIRFVMPDMGIGANGTYRNNDSSPGSLSPNYEWSATLISFSRGSGFYFDGSVGYVNLNARSGPIIVRCVGR